jgi:hypothetical protein
MNPSMRRKIYGAEDRLIKKIDAEKKKQEKEETNVR